MGPAEARRRRHFGLFLGLTSELAELHLEFQGVIAKDKTLRLDCCLLLINKLKMVSHLQAVLWLRRVDAGQSIADLW
jgi:hypothetical protein